MHKLLFLLNTHTSPSRQFLFLLHTVRFIYFNPLSYGVLSTWMRTLENINITYIVHLLPSYTAFNMTLMELEIYKGRRSVFYMDSLFPAFFSSLIFFFRFCSFPFCLSEAIKYQKLLLFVGTYNIKNKQEKIISLCWFRSLHIYESQNSRLVRLKWCK